MRRWSMTLRDAAVLAGVVATAPVWAPTVLLLCVGADVVELGSHAAGGAVNILRRCKERLWPTRSP